MSAIIFVLYIFLSPLFTPSSPFKDCKLAIESLVFQKLLTRKCLFNFSIMPPGYTRRFLKVVLLFSSFARAYFNLASYYMGHKQ